MNANDLQKQVEERALSFIKLCHESNVSALYCIRRGGNESISSVSASVEEFAMMIYSLATQYAKQFGAEAGTEYIRLLSDTLMSIDKEEFAKYCKEKPE